MEGDLLSILDVQALVKTLTLQWNSEQLYVLRRDPERVARAFNTRRWRGPKSKQLQGQLPNFEPLIALCPSRACFSTDQLSELTKPTRGF